ncbi:hypothetical protein, partial [Burkholderia vietnamiensis]|uniref:hypothetical protein n=1 Tax=Burkholderia vietnamiensis TaxID=60552 RepID=UPI001E5FA9BB
FDSLSGKFDVISPETSAVGPLISISLVESPEIVLGKRRVRWINPRHDGSSCRIAAKRQVRGTQPLFVRDTRGQSFVPRALLSGRITCLKFGRGFQC